MRYVITCIMILIQLSLAEQKMVYIPEGEFPMGTNEEEAPRNQRPQHPVYLKGYHLATHEVTNREYEQFVLAGGYNKEELWSAEGWGFLKENHVVTPAGWKIQGLDNPRCPVVGVSWYEAEAYANWVKKRLPTEAEWEKAARGTDGRLYPWGNHLQADVGYRAFAWPYIVGNFPANVSLYGIYDMAGNVWEWVLDYYDEDSYQTAVARNSQKLADGTKRVLRGGGWGSNRNQLRTTYRRAELPVWRGLDTGFRLAQD